MEKDIVFVDTCVFIHNQYFKKTNAISQLVSLASASFINILLTEITVAEDQGTGA